MYMRLQGPSWRIVDYERPTNKGKCFDCLGYKKKYRDCAKDVLSRGSVTDENDGPSFSRLKVRRC